MSRGDAALVVIHGSDGKVLGVTRRSDEGVVAWVTWEVLGRGRYGDYNRRLHSTLSAGHPHR